MAFGPSEYRVWQGIVERRRCKWCRRPIAWRTTDAGKRLPFEPNAVAARVDVHPVTLAKFDVLRPEDLHARHCPNRTDRQAASRAKKSRTKKYAVQGRLL